MYSLPIWEVLPESAANANGRASEETDENRVHRQIAIETSEQCVKEKFLFESPGCKKHLEYSER